MRNVRLAWRVCALAAFTFALFAAWLVGVPFAAALARTVAWRARVQQLWSRGVCRLAGVRVTVRGSVPRGAFFLVSNHLSSLDVVVLGGLAPCSFVAAAEIAGWPVLGFLARAFGTLFVERERHRTLGASNRRLAARLAHGAGLVLFPEGTSTSGEGVLRFRSALLEPAATLALPVRYATLRYATPSGERPAAEVVCWSGDRTFARHALELLRLARVEAEVRFGAEPIADSDRKRLAARLWQAVSDTFEPLSRAPDARASLPCAPPAG